ncbi:Csi1p LALA0_S02e00364g [Lachancea lanzarotensis]|uniref:LALA0S02e00364g1_1 n=1 Tax=Lachancea lanzarotensis TaxID=1245769 RepID=A0A0C7N5W7_9SACH|nr:uncharacterized protein LALA0_S02e00364g [Lachancea lanzarotensis]CEP60820.1 LALA0S02e00364g1_1 [Lachancea lanzarotensis]
MEVLLPPVIILQVNQSLDVKRVLGGSRPEPLCLLLFGEISHSNVIVHYGLELPLLEENGTISYASDALNKRIGLVRSVLPQLQLLGIIFVIDSSLPFHFDTILDALMSEVETLKSFLIYTIQGNKLDLRCHQIDEPRHRMPVRFLNNDTLLAAIDDSQHLRNEDKNDHEKQKDFKEKLISRISNIIRYLEQGQVTDSILRKINLLVLQLKKAPTNDIEQQVLEKEMELQLLNIICDQWETGHTLGRSDP